MGFIKQALLILVFALAINFIPLLWRQRPPLNVDGYFHPDFKKVADVFREWFQVRSEDDGVAFALYHKGELVLDMWGGYADLESERPWHKDTISEIFSATKGVAAIVVAMMVEKGLLDYKKPVSHYWPEFAQNGKDNITVEMLVSHQAGLLLLDTPIHYRDLKDNIARVEESLVNQKPVFTPGTAYGYHALTYGLYVDRLVAKADPKRRTMEQIFEEEIAKPFDIDFRMNTPKMELHRVARLRSPSLWAMLKIWILEPHRIWGFLKPVMINSPYLKGAGSAIAGLSKLEHHNNPDIREVTISSYSGTGTARGLAKLYGILANGGSTNGKQLLSKATIENLSIPAVAGEDVLFQLRSVIFGPGTMLKNNTKGQYMFGHPGYGGQEGYGDLNTGLGIGFITNCIIVETSSSSILSGYNYCGPGTRLDIRLDNQDQPRPGEYPINAIDTACHVHIVANKSKDLQQRHIADVKLIHALNSITNKSFKESSLANWLVRSAMKCKLVLRAGN